MPRDARAPLRVDDLPLFGGRPVPAPTYVSPAAAKARDAAIAALQKKSGEGFIAAASAFVLEHLRTHGPKTGEQLTDAAKKAGIVPGDDREFGPVYSSLHRRGLIHHHGYAPRSKGHGAVGNVWAAKGRDSK